MTDLLNDPCPDDPSTWHQNQPRYPYRGPEWCTNCGKHREKHTPAGNGGLDCPDVTQVPNPG